jgi:two-component sensor histidine kinase
VRPVEYRDLAARVSNHAELLDFPRSFRDTFSPHAEHVGDQLRLRECVRDRTNGWLATTLCAQAYRPPSGARVGFGSRGHRELSAMGHSGNSGSQPEPATAEKFLNGGPWTLHECDGQSRQIAMIAHELRNSLAVIRNAARLLHSPMQSVIVDRARSLIERQVGQMSRHLADLLEPQHRGPRDMGLLRSHVDLRMIVRDAIDGIAPEMERRGHRLVVQLPEAPAWAHADGARLEQVFSNLLINAAKYTPERGNIRLRMQRVDESWIVRIRDSGIGLESAMLTRVFGMFVQGATAPTAGENGSGIGLAVVRSIVEQHGGTVAAKSAGLGLGSEFTVVLPSLPAQHESVIIVP